MPVASGRPGQRGCEANLLVATESVLVSRGSRGACREWVVPPFWLPSPSSAGASRLEAFLDRTTTMASRPSKKLSRLWRSRPAVTHLLPSSRQSVPTQGQCCPRQRQCGTEHRPQNSLLMRLCGCLQNRRPFANLQKLKGFREGERLPLKSRVFAGYQGIAEQRPMSPRLDAPPADIQASAPPSHPAHCHQPPGLPACACTALRIAVLVIWRGRYKCFPDGRLARL
jgi:hypothetical protein